VKPLRPPFIAQERHNTCCLACLRMALVHQELDVPSEEGLIAEANLEAEGKRQDDENRRRIADELTVDAQELGMGY
jgi:hypothetical protein